jgi:hypothetical protein
VNSFLDIITNINAVRAPAKNSIPTNQFKHKNCGKALAARPEMNIPQMEPTSAIAHFFRLSENIAPKRVKTLRTPHITQHIAAHTQMIAITHLKTDGTFVILLESISSESMEPPIDRNESPANMNIIMAANMGLCVCAEVAGVPGGGGGAECPGGGGGGGGGGGFDMILPSIISDVSGDVFGNIYAVLRN